MGGTAGRPALGRIDTRSAALVRASSLHGYVELAAELGLDGRAALRTFAISERALVDPTLLISQPAVSALLEFSARRADCPDFGIRLGRRQGLGILGPVTALIRHAPTIGDALGLASRYMFVHSPTISLDVVAVAGEPELVDLCFDIHIPGRPPCPQNIELSLTLMNEGLRIYSMGVVRPRLARFPHPRVGPLATYLNEFRCECRFGAPVAALRLAAADLGRSLAEGDPLILRLTQDYLDGFRAGDAASIADRVRALLRRALGSGDCSRPSVARALGLHPRTLQRRLAAEGHPFERLLDDTRRDLLQDLLRLHPDLPLGRIAVMLGYGDQSALTRSCRRWFGVSPRQMRGRVLAR